MGHKVVSHSHLLNVLFLFLLRLPFSALYIAALNFLSQ